MSEDNEATTSPAETYKLTLQGGGLSVDREVDQATAFQILAAIMGGASPLPVAVGGGGRSAAATELFRPRGAAARLSLREHMDEVGATRNPDKILAIAAYLTDTRGMSTFSTDDVKKEFKNAAEPVPANYARDWRWAVSNGWLAADHEEAGEFYVTDKGRDALEAKFSGEVKKATSLAGRRRRPRKKSDES